MASEFFHVNASAQCPHATGQVLVTSVNTRVTVSGLAVATTADRFTVASCPQPASNKPPCLTVQWSQVASRVKVMGKPVVLRSSRGQAYDASQALQGTVSVTATQTRVKGT
jgi:uncharacterized Zn-binding protein involved in type VI secretion